MSITSAISITDIKTEIVNDLRANITDPRARITFTSQYFNGTGSAVAFTVTQGAIIKCVKYVKVATVTKSYGTDYSVNFDSGIITFTTAPVAGTNNIEINYGYKDGGVMVYPDFPRDDLNMAQYPRIAISAMITTKELDVGGRAFNNDLTITALILAENTGYLDNLAKQVRDRIMSNRKNYYNFRYIFPTAENDIQISEDRTADVCGRVIDFKIPDRIEVLN